MQHQKQKALSAFYEAAVRNHEQALGALEKLSSTDRDAAFLFAQILESKHQYTQAILFYRQANILAHAEGLYRVAKLVDHLSSTEKKDKTREDYYRDAIQAGSKYALEELSQLSGTSGKASFYIGKVCENDLRQIDRALLFYEKASEQGYGEATHYLGDIYAKGRSNIPVDMTKASCCYLVASQQGYTTAVSSLESLARSGHAQAQYTLGHDYYRVKNMSHAIAWCIKAEIQGHAGAVSYLKGDFSADQHWSIANLYLQHGVTHENQRWIFHCQQAARKHHPGAVFYFAQQLEGESEAGHRHAVNCWTCYDTAAKSGNSESQAATDRFSCQWIHPLSFFSSSGSDGIKNVQSLSSVQNKMKHKK